MIGASFVLDNSIVMAWCYENEATSMTRAALEYLHANVAVVPAIWPLEFGNALLAGERRRKLEWKDTVRYLEIVKNLAIRVEQERPERVFNAIVSLARQYDLTTYDASYLDLAMRTGLPLATLDKQLLKAAKKSGVSVFGEKGRS